MGDTLYGYTLAEHEYKVTVPCLYQAPSGEPTVIIAVSAHGGGTIGKAYAGSWDYGVYVNGAEVIAGQELRSPANGATHEEMARELAGFLSAYGESLRLSGDDSEYAADYRGAARDFLVAEYERLALFADDES
jgi:hypothetical protein